MEITKIIFGIGWEQLYALKDEQGETTNNRNEMIKDRKSITQKIVYIKVKKGKIKTPNEETVNIEIFWVNTK